MHARLVRACIQHRRLRTNPLFYRLLIPTIPLSVSFSFHLPFRPPFHSTFLSPFLSTFLVSARSESIIATCLLRNIIATCAQQNQFSQQDALNWFRIPKILKQWDNIREIAPFLFFKSSPHFKFNFRFYKIFSAKLDAILSWSWCVRLFFWNFRQTILHVHVARLVLIYSYLAPNKFAFL